MSIINSATNEVKEKTINSSILSSDLQEFIAKSSWDPFIQEDFLKFLDQHSDIRSKLNILFKDTSLFSQCIPIITYLERSSSFTVLFVNKQDVPPEPGEPGSLLSYFRSYGYTDATLCSDCYGQLSCSSCAVEIMNGSPENPTPRDEEFDMLSIDVPHDRRLCTYITPSLS